MKKRGILALLLAGILTASVSAVAAHAEETQKPDSAAEITAEITAENAADEETDHPGKPDKSRSEAADTASGTEKTEKSGLRKGRKAETAEPEGTIGRDAAKEAALADAGIEAEGHVHARYKEEDGAGFYKVKFKADGQVYRYRIDAKTGEVLEKSLEEESEESGEKQQIGKKRKGSGSSDAETAEEQPEQGR